MSKIIGFEIFDDRVDLEILRPRKGEHKQTYGLCGRTYTVPMSEIEHIFPRPLNEGEKLMDYLISFCAYEKYSFRADDRGNLGTAMRIVDRDYCIETHSYKDDDDNVVNTITGIYDLFPKNTDATAGRT